MRARPLRRLEKEDFAVRIESTHSIDIIDFVDLTQVDPKSRAEGRRQLCAFAQGACRDGQIGVAKVVISNEYLLR
jgi:hypothetical protein